MDRESSSEPLSTHVRNGFHTRPHDFEDEQPPEANPEDFPDMETSAPAPSDRDQIVKTLEEARFQTFHMKVIGITALTFFSDSYCLFLPTIVTPMIGLVYFRGPPHHGSLPLREDLLLKGLALVGTIIGMIGFGVYGDLVGRKKAFLPTLLLILVSCLGGAFAADTYSGLSMVWILGFWRFILGIGVGGDYSLNASIIAEYSPRCWRGAFIAGMFAMQGFGILFAALVGMGFLAAFRSKILQDLNALDNVWRIVVGFGALPVVGALLLRIKLPESPRFTIEINNNPTLAKSNMQALMGFGKVREDLGSDEYGRNQITWTSFQAYVKRYWLILFAPAMCWLLLDVGYYAQNFLSANVMTEIGHIPSAKVQEPETVFTRVFNICRGQAMLALMGTIPGYWVTVLLVERMGRKPLQLLGFAIMTILFWIMALAYPILTSSSNSQWGFVVLYSLTFFFANFGPNATTFIIPAEIFETRFRSTCYGICAAAGKVGATIALFGFGSFDRVHMPQAMIGVLSIPMVLGLLTTFLIPETGHSQSLDAIQDEVEEWVKKWTTRPKRKGLEPVPSSIPNSAVHNWVPSPPRTPFYGQPPPGYQSPGSSKGGPDSHLERARSIRSGVSMSPHPSDLPPRTSDNSSQAPEPAAAHPHGPGDLPAPQQGSGYIYEGPAWVPYAPADPYTPYWQSEGHSLPQRPPPPSFLYEAPDPSLYYRDPDSAVPPQHVSHWQYRITPVPMNGFPAQAPAGWGPPSLRGSGPSGGIYQGTALSPGYDEHPAAAGYPDRAGSERVSSPRGSPGTGAKRKPRPPE